jgi:homoprotocatechuate degradation regulator HpaR
MMTERYRLPPYRASLAGSLLAAREAVMAPIRPILRDAGVTEQQWRVLRVLDDIGAVDPTRLADAALLYAPSVTRILKELVERGLISRMADPQDGRRSIVELSPQGRGLIEQTSRQTGALLEAYHTSFGQDRMTALLHELAALKTAIQGRDPSESHD